MKNIKAVVTLGDFPGVAPVSLRALPLESLRSFPEGVHLTGKEWILRAFHVPTNFSEGLPVLSFLAMIQLCCCYT